MKKISNLAAHLMPPRDAWPTLIVAAAEALIFAVIGIIWTPEAQAGAMLISLPVVIIAAGIISTALMPRWEEEKRGKAFDLFAGWIMGLIFSFMELVIAYALAGGGV